LNKPPPKSKFQIGDFVISKDNVRYYRSSVGIIVGVRYRKDWWECPSEDANKEEDPYLYSVAWILKKNNNKRPVLYDYGLKFAWSDYNLERYVSSRKKK